MKPLFVLLCILCVHKTIAQPDLPDWSPRTTISQRVGYTNFTLDYSRPAARGRVIMGDLVKFGEVWRTGASKTTIISFDQSVRIGSGNVSAGTYALVSIPDRETWTVLLNSDTAKYYGDPSEYDAKTEVARIIVPSEKTSTFVESLNISFDIVQSDAIVSIAWENTVVRFKIETGADALALKRIDEALAAHQKDHEILGRSAFYYLMNRKDPARTLDLINRALALKQEVWYHEQKVTLLASIKKYAEARVAAREAIEYLRKDKPQYWESSVTQFENQVRSLPH